MLAVFVLSMAASRYGFYQIQLLPLGHVMWNVSGENASQELKADMVATDPIAGIAATEVQGVLAEIAASGGGGGFDNPMTVDLQTNDFFIRKTAASDMQVFVGDAGFSLFFTGGSNDWLFNDQSLKMPLLSTDVTNTESFYLKTFDANGETQQRPYMRLSDDYPIGNPGLLPSTPTQILTDRDIKQWGPAINSDQVISTSVVAPQDLTDLAVTDIGVGRYRFTLEIYHRKSTAVSDIRTNWHLSITGSIDQPNSNWAFRQGAQSAVSLTSQSIQGATYPATTNLYRSVITGKFEVTSGTVTFQPQVQPILQSGSNDNVTYEEGSNLVITKSTN